MAKRIGAEEVQEDDPIQEKELEEVFGDDQQLIGTKDGKTKKITKKEAKMNKIKDYDSITPNQTDAEDGFLK